MSAESNHHNIKENPFEGLLTAQMNKIYGLLSLALIIIGCNTKDTSMTASENPYYSRTDTTALNVPDAEWKKVLPDSVYRIARLKETERAHTGKYWDATGVGTYYCAPCGNALFRSDSWFASGC